LREACQLDFLEFFSRNSVRWKYGLIINYTLTRFLNADGRIAWKATPGMLSRLADAEQEAIDDMEDCP
jgi:hypothetical protein